MSETEQAGLEVRRIRRMLRAMERMARESSMTGSLQGGVRASVQQYNLWLEHLERAGVVPAGLFPPLAEDVSFDEVGVAASLLLSYLEEDEEEGHQPPGPPGPPGRRFGRPGMVGSHNVFIGMGRLKQLEER